jgi:hypothetical protein
MISGAAVAFFEGERRRALVAGFLLGAVFMGHLLVIHLRPSGTSVTDLAIYGTCLVPLALALGRPAYGRYLVAAGFVVAAIVVPPVALLPLAQPPSSMIASINEAAAYIRDIKRQVVVVFHDNRAHPLTIEALALYTGQLPPVVGGSSWLREQFLGNARLLSDPHDTRELLPAIMRGDVIIWGSAPGAPAAETYFPELKSLTDNEQGVLRTFEIEQGSHTAHIGYLPAPCVTARTAASLPDPRCGPSR